MDYYYNVVIITKYYIEGEKIIMKHKLLKLLSFVLSLSFVFSLSIPTLASASELESTYGTTTSEYDLYYYVRTTDNQTLLKEGFDSVEIQEIKSDKIENELSERAELPEEILEDKYGYSQEQIEIIKSYDGEPIEENISLRGIFANVTCNFVPLGASTTYMAMKVEYAWDNCPLLVGVTDAIGLRWKGTNLNGAPINLALATTSANCRVTYYNSANNTTYSAWPVVQSDDPYGNAYVNINLWSDNYFAKSGSITVYLSTTGTDKISEAAFIFSYGHPVITVSPGISFPYSFSISFGTGVEKMIEKAIRYHSDGSITSYN
jgi:hypothetical protein